MTRIIAYRFSAFGDVAMTVPVFKEILEQNPNLEIIMVSRSSFKDAFNGFPRLIFKGINVDDYKGFFGMKRLADEIHKEYNPDYVADLHDVIRSKILNRVFKNKGYKVFKLNKGKEEKENLTDIHNIDKKPLKRTIERYADVFREMGFPLTLHEKLVPLHKDKNGVGIAPFAQHQGKILPLEKTFELARIISRNHKIYFFGGGKKEVEILTKWEKLIPNSENLAGKLTLKEELEKISGLKVMVSMDSANMHLASLVGTRCVSVWGATHPHAGFLGYGQSEEDAVQINDLSCRPCSVFGDKECYRGDYACLEELSVQMIIDKINRQ
ncbi:MAG: glycosyltransferase family 9 protein [Bergeyella sp.]